MRLGYYPRHPERSQTCGKHHQIYLLDEILRYSASYLLSIMGSLCSDLEALFYLFLNQQKDWGNIYWLCLHRCILFGAERKRQRIVLYDV
jgi:hypothetical protein